ncbi:MAG: ABC transporter permease [Candidatus Aminicenantes bacterium]|nr:ABC transporter permease [Candidatus Aminicenantes bacterium]
MILAFFRNLFRDLVRQPLRTFLTLSGVTWGTFAVILLLAFGTGIGKQQMKQFRGMGQSIILVFPGQTTMTYNGLPKGRRIQVTPDELPLLQARVPGIRALSPEFISSRNIRHGREQLLNTVRGVDVPFERIRNTIPGQGRFINEYDVEQHRRNCFLGATIAKNLFKGMEPVGKQVMIEGVPFTVVGVMIEKDQNSNYNGMRDTHCAFIPWTTYMTLYGVKYVQNFIVQPSDPALSKQTIAALRNYFGERLGFNPLDKDALSVWDFSDFERQFNMFFTAFNIFLGIIGSFTLLVGGVGVASIMLVVVEERIREIGIKLAVGAKRRAIMWQFFAEANCIILIGGTIGFLLAALLLALLPAKQLEEYIGIPKLNPLVGIVTVLILLAIGTLSGLTPARRAAATDPIVALRK